METYSANRLMDMPPATRIVQSSNAFSDYIFLFLPMNIYLHDVCNSCLLMPRQPSYIAEILTYGSQIRTDHVWIHF